MKHGIKMAALVILVLLLSELIHLFISVRVKRKVETFLTCETGVAPGSVPIPSNHTLLFLVLRLLNPTLTLRHSFNAFSYGSRIVGHGVADYSPYCDSTSQCLNF